ncbi:MAG: type IV toxin-antitoxin system AbiEi family antitoxin domain-containing protein [Parachlamydiaceae bacterium]|nr:type IV toxin-antitoxin system AbiEi family antitoxin domain-containing protein [Parachlamydiaceae bacterium]
MRPKSCLQLLTPLLNRASFTSKEVRDIGVPSAVLSYYVKAGKLKKIKRGVYQAIDYHNPSSFRWADLIDAVFSINSSVVCLISALAVYDLTEEIPRQHWIGIRHETSARSNRQIKIVRFRDLDLGRTEMELEGVLIPIFDKERTIIDTFRLLSRETAIKALKEAVAKGGKDRIDFIKLEQYAKKLHFDITPYLLSITT